MKSKHGQQGQSSKRELWTNKHFLLGKSAIEIPPRNGPVVSFEQSTQFIFGERTYFMSFSDSIAQVLGMISALLTEHMQAFQEAQNEKAAQKAIMVKSARELSAFHSFYPATSVKEPPAPIVPKPLGSRVV
jgi:hypothetical protein